jgi:hypothetical protein
MKRRIKTRRRKPRNKSKRRYKGGDFTSFAKGLFRTPIQVTTEGPNEGPKKAPIQRIGAVRLTVLRDKLKDQHSQLETAFTRNQYGSVGYYATIEYVIERMDELMTNELQQACGAINDNAYRARWLDFIKWRYKNYSYRKQPDVFERTLIEKQQLFVECLAQAINVVKLRYYCVANELCKPKIILKYDADEILINTLQKIEDFVCLFIDLCSFEARTPAAIFNLYGIKSGENSTSYSQRGYCNAMKKDVPTASPYEIVTTIATEALSIYGDDVYPFNATLMDVAIAEKNHELELKQNEMDAAETKRKEEYNFRFPDGSTKRRRETNLSRI